MDESFSIKIRKEIDGDDSSYGIINDGEPTLIFKEEGPCKTLTIQNGIGICLLMPVRIEDDPEEDWRVVIEVDA